MQEGQLSGAHPDFRNYDYGRYTKEGPHHRFRLSSAYEALGEPPFTNFTDEQYQQLAAFLEESKGPQGGGG